MQENLLLDSFQDYFFLYGCYKKTKDLLCSFVILTANSDISL